MVAILDCVVEAAGPLPLAVLTRRTEIPKSTVRRIADDLVRRGMFERTAEGYRPGHRLLHQGLLVTHHHGLSATVQPYLQDLHLRSRGQAAWFATLNNGELVMAGAAFGRQHAAEMARPWFPSVSRIGPQMALFAAGRIEAAERPELVDRIMRGRWAPLTRYSVTDRRRLGALLREARDSGFAHETEQTVLGVSCMAAALRDSSQRLVGILGIAGECNSVEARGVHAGLRRSAELLQRDLRSASAGPESGPWTGPMFDRRTGIGYSWPMMNAPEDAGPMFPR